MEEKKIIDRLIIKVFDNFKYEEMLTYDIRNEAANKNSNYVLIKDEGLISSPSGRTSNRKLTGILYRCEHLQIK